MNYEPLNKLYYCKSKDEYQSECIARRDGELSVRLPIDIKGNQAFYVPAPEIYDTIIEIYKTDKKISRIADHLPGVAVSQFAIKSLIGEIVLTNNIEGVHSTRREIQMTLDNIESTGKRDRFFGLVKKYEMLSKDKLTLVHCEDIRSIYDELVLDEVVSENENNRPDGRIFRKNSVSVDNEFQREIHRGIFPEGKIIDTMETALEFLNDSSKPLLIRISVFHYLFGYIHPFYEGNGRTSRFISSYLLSTEFEPLIGYRLSYTIKENISKYYNAFKICNDEKNFGDITPFIIIFLNIVKISFEQLYKALEERQQKLEYYENRIGLLVSSKKTKKEAQKDTTIIHLLLQAGLFSESGISMCDLMKYSETSRTTVKNRIDELGEKDLVITKTHKGNSKYYLLDLEKFDSIISE